MTSLDWFDVFDTVCVRGREALEWGLPEAWVHAELYAELRRRSALSGWEPFSTEVPYVTFYPVQLPRKEYRDWDLEGAVKWVDLCLRSEEGKGWCWFEFKVRHIGEADRERKAALDARDAVRKDVVALIGFDAARTAETWSRPDEYTVAYWFEGMLKPYAKAVETGQHDFVTAFLQLGGKLDEVLWDEEEFFEEVRRWLAYRSRRSKWKRPLPGFDVMVGEIGRGHSLLVCRWGAGRQGRAEKMLRGMQA